MSHLSLPTQPLPIHTASVLHEQVIIPAGAEPGTDDTATSYLLALSRPDVRAMCELDWLAMSVWKDVPTPTVTNKVWTVQEFENLMKMTQQEAAKKEEISITKLKKIMKQLGIKNWPRTSSTVRCQKLHLTQDMVSAYNNGRMTKGQAADALGISYSSLANFTKNNRIKWGLMSRFRKS